MECDIKPIKPFLFTCHTIVTREILPFSAICVTCHTIVTFDNTSISEGEITVTSCHSRAVAVLKFLKNPGGGQKLKVHFKTARDRRFAAVARGGLGAPLRGARHACSASLS